MSMKKIAVVFLYNLFIISNLFAIDQPTLYSPSNATNLENSVRVELVWNRMTVATGYEIEIDTASSFDSPVYSLYDSFTYSTKLLNHCYMVRHTIGELGQQMILTLPTGLKYADLLLLRVLIGIVPILHQNWKILRMHLCNGTR